MNVYFMIYDYPARIIPFKSLADHWGPQLTEWQYWWSRFPRLHVWTPTGAQ